MLVDGRQFPRDPCNFEPDNILLFRTGFFVVYEYTLCSTTRSEGRASKYSPSGACLCCLAHALHRVAEEVRESYSDVDKLIANGKKTFVKVPLRLQKFKGCHTFSGHFIL
jgi:hypothetical protein